VKNSPSQEENSIHGATLHHRSVRTDDGLEVDFLARDPEGRAELIQVCADASDPATADRECRALAEAGKRFPGAGRRLLTLTRDGAPAQAPPGVLAQPAYEWMLAGPASA